MPRAMPADPPGEALYRAAFDRMLAKFPKISDHIADALKDGLVADEIAAKLGVSRRLPTDLSHALASAALRNRSGDARYR